MLVQDSPSAFDQMDFAQDIPGMMDVTNRDFNKVVFGENQFDFADLADDDEQIQIAQNQAKDKKSILQMKKVLMGTDTNLNGKVTKMKTRIRGNDIEEDAQEIAVQMMRQLKLGDAAPSADPIDELLGLQEAENN